MVRQIKYEAFQLKTLSEACQ